MTTSQNRKNAQPTETSFDSMRAAASAMNVRMVELKAAKRAGCPAFRGGRVYPLVLRQWLESRKEKLDESGVVSKEALECRKLLGQCERIEFENEVEHGRFLKKEDVARALRRIGEAQKTMLLSKCRNELAPKLHGLSIPDQFKVLEEFALGVVDVFNRGVLQWTK